MPNEFENEVGELLKKFEFEAYWPNADFPVSSLNTNAALIDPIQIDIIAKKESIGFIIEVTKDQDFRRNIKKIEDLIKKTKAIKNANLTNRQIASLFTGIPRINTNDFDIVREWRCIYITTCEELVYKNIKESDYPDNQCLKIINLDDWNYINLLEAAIGVYAKNEFLSLIGLIEENTDTIPFKPLLVKNRYITKQKLNSDIYLFDISPEEILKTCKVERFEGLRVSESKDYYQRMININKLEQIRTFIKEDQRISFPTPITIVMPKVIGPDEEGVYRIPKKYGSIIIIDGQHRLFAYAHPDLSDIRINSKLLINGIKFDINNCQESQIKQATAQTFFDINGKQITVKSALLDLVSYDALGDTTDRAIAAKILYLCNEIINSDETITPPLYDLFEIRIVGRDSRLKIDRIKITEVITNFAKLIKDVRKLKNPFLSNLCYLLYRDTIITRDIGNFRIQNDRILISNDIEEGIEYILFNSANLGGNLDKLKGKIYKIDRGRSSTHFLTSSDEIFLELSTEAEENESGNRYIPLKLELDLTNPEDIIKIGKSKLLTRYFNVVKNVFNEDWVNESRSDLFTARYFSAFILLLKYFIKGRNNYDDICTKLNNIKSNILQNYNEFNDNVPQTERSQIFHKKRKGILHSNSSKTIDIYNWLIELL